MRCSHVCWQADQPGFSWRFNPGYWARHATKDWGLCPDLYSTKDFVVAVPKARLAFVFLHSRLACQNTYCFLVVTCDAADSWKPDT
jgi:hypothetical protein